VVGDDPAGRPCHRRLLLHEYDGSFSTSRGCRRRLPLVELKIEPVPRRASARSEGASRRPKEDHVHCARALPSVNIGDLDDELFEEAKRAYADARSFAARIEARAITFHAGKISREAWLPKTWDICRKRSIQGIAGILDSAPSSAPQAAVENLGQSRWNMKYGVTVPELTSAGRWRTDRLSQLTWATFARAGSPPHRPRWG
jgi:hypothetical protein